MKTIQLKPIGFVANKINNRSEMSHGGAPSTIKILPRYRRALLGIGKYTHIWVMCFFDKADRAVLRARPRKISSTLAERGVFAMRSPDRPNPVSLSCARLVSVKGGKLKLAALDAVNKTPVLDIKPYSHGIDCVQAASSPDFTAKYRLADDRFVAGTFARIAANACGALDRQAICAAALALRYTRITRKSPGPRAGTIKTNLAGAGLDALYALFRFPPSSGAVRRLPTRGAPFISIKNLKITLDAGFLSYFKALLPVFAENRRRRYV